MGIDLEVDNDDDYGEEDFHDGSGYGKNDPIYDQNKEGTGHVNKPSREDMERIR